MKDKKKQPDYDTTNDAVEAKDTESQTAPEAASVNNAQSEKSGRNTVDDADQRVAELINDLQRTRADFENYRKQIEIQRAQTAAAVKSATVEQFLPLIDDFDRALTIYAEQLAPLQKTFNKTLAELKLTKIDSEPGTEFNPDYHEAVSVEDDDGEREVVAETLRPGYLYDGEVIRAAMVKVKHI